MSIFANPLATGNWVAAWAGPIAKLAAPQVLRDQTVRLRIEASIGGRALRIVLTNEYGTAALRIGAASVALFDRNGEEGNPTPLLFGGQAGIDIPIGALAVSNEIAIDVAPGQHLSVKLFLPNEALAESGVFVQGPELPLSHPLAVPLPAFTRVEVSSEGDFTAEAYMPVATPWSKLPFLARIDLLAAQDVGAIAVLGTTYTDGLDVWPDRLSTRLNAEAGAQKFSIINLSARGGSLSRGHAPSGREGVVTLLDREVLTLPGISHIIVSEARQDIATSGAVSLRADGSRPDAGEEGISTELPVTVASLKAAYRQVIAKAHIRGIKVLAATMPPFRSDLATGYYSEAKDEMREELNRWILESGEFDGVIDIDRHMRDPKDTRQFKDEYRSSNRFGPNPAGHIAIAAAIDLAIFD